MYEGGMTVDSKGGDEWDNVMYNTDSALWGCSGQRVDPVSMRQSWDRVGDEGGFLDYDLPFLHCDLPRWTDVVIL